jgi:hypothetical protein
LEINFVFLYGVFHKKRKLIFLNISVRIMIKFLKVSLTVLLNLAILASLVNAQNAVEGISLSDEQVSSLVTTSKFIRNEGQWNQDVLFLLQSPGMNAWITKSGIRYDYYLTHENTTDETVTIDGHVLDINFQNIAGYENIQIKTTNPAKTRYNYFIGKDASKHAKEVSSFDEILIAGVYEKIDLRIYSDNGNVRYDFIASPGADLNQISVAMSGADDIEMLENGDINLRTSVGDVHHGQVYAYQIINGNEKEVACKMTLNNSEYDFALGEYNPNYDLIIDPLTAATFVGGGGAEQVTGSNIAIDGNGDVYIAGSVFSNATEYPTTAGAYSETHSGSSDMFVSKLSSDLSSLDYSTFVGGARSDYARGLAIGSGGNIYICGHSDSDDFPGTTGKYQAALGYDGGSYYYDAVVFILNSTLSSLSGATYLGEQNASDYAHDIALDGSNNIYIAGYTSDASFPVTGSAYDQVIGGSRDAFVALLSNDLTSLTASTYVGGTGSEFCYELTRASNGDIYITGETPDGFPTTGSAYDQTHNGGNDIYIACLSSNLQTLKYSTYLGTTAGDRGEAITSSGTNIYVSGFAGASGFPTTAGAYDETYNGSLDGVIAILPLDLSTVTAATYLGGAEDQEYLRGIAVDGDGNVYVVGYSSSSNYPTTAGAHDQTLTYNGNRQPDIVASKLSSDLSSLEYSTYLGTESRNYGESLALDASNNVYVYGYTDDYDTPFATTAGAYDQTANGTDAVVAILNMASATAPTLTTTAMSSITTATASSGGNTISDGGDAVTAKGVVWSTTATPALTTNETGHTSDGTGTTDFSSSITGLSVNTLYYVRAYATNTNGDGYGNEISFYSAANVPNAPTVDNPTTTTLDVTLDVNSNPASTEFAIQETGSGNYVQSADGSLGAVADWQANATWGTKTVTGLTAGTTYTFKVKARNGDDTETAFGATASEQTYKEPTVTTQAVSSITNTTAVGNGNITDLGVPNPTQYGVCWNTGGTPTTADSKTEEGAIALTGAFTSNMSGLTANTTYYVRAYATNSANTVYGTQVSFSTDEEYSEIEIEYDNSEVLHNGTLNLGEAALGSTYNYNFALNNIGQYSALTVAGSAVAISGVDASKFSVSQQPGTSVAAGSSTTFTVTYTPTEVGTDNATITVTNSETVATDGINEQAYSFDISVAASLKFITVTAANVEFRSLSSNPNPVFEISLSHDDFTTPLATVTPSVTSGIALGTKLRTELTSGTTYYVRYRDDSATSGVWSFILSPAGTGVMEIGDQ